MNACRDQGRKAGTIDCEDAQKTLCSQLADTSMTTVKQTHTTKQKTKSHLSCFHSASSEIIFTKTACCPLGYVFPCSM